MNHINHSSDEGMFVWTMIYLINVIENWLKNKMKKRVGNAGELKFITIINHSNQINHKNHSLDKGNQMNHSSDKSKTT